LVVADTIVPAVLHIRQQLKMMIHSENKHNSFIGRCSTEKFPSRKYDVWVVNRNVYSNSPKIVRLQNACERNNLEVVLIALNTPASC